MVKNNIQYGYERETYLSCPNWHQSLAEAYNSRGKKLQQLQQQQHPSQRWLLLPVEEQFPLSRTLVEIFPSSQESVSSWIEVVVEVLANLPTNVCLKNLREGYHRLAFSSRRKRQVKHRQSKDWSNSCQILTGKESARINDNARGNFINF